ncbi:cupin domain-containing protein [Flavobacteriaceae sp. LMIT009]
MNLTEKLTHIKEYFAPKVIGEVNDVFIKLAKIKGNEVPWHNHKNEDELFFILEGSLLFEIENKPPFTLQQGDLYIVKKGINHRVSSKEECHIMLVENKTTLHTGNAKHKITKSIDKQFLKNCSNFKQH